MDAQLKNDFRRTYWEKIMKQVKKSNIASAVGAVVLGSLATISVEANADLFAMNSLDAGYMQEAAEGKCGEGKCGEGKCGGKASKEGKCGEGKCGEGKCGGKASKEGKCGEGKCGEGKCGGKASKEGKCGEGKCGGQA